MIPRKQIGFSNEENLLWEISKQLDKLLCINTTCKTISTTTTTTTLNPLIETNYTFINCGTDCNTACALPYNYFTVWMLESCVNSWPSLGCEVWLNIEKTIPFPSGSYPNGLGTGCIVITGGIITNII
jgi:hypothetical protein